MIFIFIQTNRVKLKEILFQFERCYESGEFMVAPRPLPSTSFKYYFAYGLIAQASKAHSLFSSLSKNRELLEVEFMELVSSTEYFWFAGCREAYRNAIKEYNK